MDREDTERGSGLKAISVVIPIFNEEENISPLYKALKPIIKGMRLEYEVIFVDDGSDDGSGEVLQQLAQGDKRIKVIQFRKNFGQTAAIAARRFHIHYPPGERCCPPLARLPGIRYWCCYKSLPAHGHRSCHFHPVPCR